MLRTDVSEECNASITKVTRIFELGITSAVTSNQSLCRWLVVADVAPSSPIHVILMTEALGSSETSVLTRATRRNVLEDGILHSHLRENLKSYMQSPSFNVNFMDIHKKICKLVGE
jgi:hypothetical protein